LTLILLQSPKETCARSNMKVSRADQGALQAVLPLPHRDSSASQANAVSQWAAFLLFTESCHEVASSETGKFQ